MGGGFSEGGGWGCDGMDFDYIPHPDSYTAGLDSKLMCVPWANAIHKAVQCFTITTTSGHVTSTWLTDDRSLHIFTILRQTPFQLQ